MFTDNESDSDARKRARTRKKTYLKMEDAPLWIKWIVHYFGLKGLATIVPIIMVVMIFLWRYQVNVIKDTAAQRAVQFESEQTILKKRIVTLETEITESIALLESKKGTNDSLILIYKDIIKENSEKLKSILLSDNKSLHIDESKSLQAEIDSSLSEIKTLKKENALIAQKITKLRQLIEKDVTQTKNTSDTNEIALASTPTFSAKPEVLSTPIPIKSPTTENNSGLALKSVMNTPIPINTFDQNEYTETVLPSTLIEQINSVSTATPKSIPSVIDRPTSRKLSQAVVVAGGGDYPGNAISEQTKQLSEYAYRIFLERGYEKENIRWLSAFRNEKGEVLQQNTSNGTNDVSGYVTKEKLKSTIFGWGDGNIDVNNRNFFLYMIGHSYLMEEEVGEIESYFRINPEETISSKELDSWLDDLQMNNPNVEVILVVDSAYSGHFIKNNSPPTGSERIVISSTDASTEAVIMPPPDLSSFSYQFFTHLYFDATMEEAFLGAQSFTELLFLNQNPEFDDNGDGIYSKQDGIVLQNKRLGYAKK